MEGLLIAEQLDGLTGGFPFGRSAWSFPATDSAVLPLHGAGSLEIRTDRARPSLALVSGRQGEREAPRTPFQRQLAARAGGDLLAAEQLALDRVVFMRFGASAGFVPEPPVTLVVELTGKNANLAILDDAGRILGVERQVGSDRNRYRELRAGAKYVPPPPYEKLDPRSAGAERLRAALNGRTLGQVRDVVDGIGPTLQAAIENAVWRKVEGAPADVMTGALLDATLEAMAELVEGPSAFLAAFGSENAEASRSAARGGQELQRRARTALASAIRLARRRSNDAERALGGVDEPARLRAEADLLLATAGTWIVNGSRATLVGLDGETVELEIDPRRDAAGNAQLRYDRARRREARRKRAAAQLPELRSEVARLEALEAGLGGMSHDELAALASELAPDERGSGAGKSRAGTSEVGVRFRDPRGFEVVVGRNARENDAVTFRVARSRDVWLHAQGYRGAHVIIRSGGGKVPFESVLFAARLAAGFSEARRSGNVPVDYTERKNVWRAKGGGPGAVHYSQQKTVYVDPARDEQAAEGTARPGRQT